MTPGETRSAPVHLGTGTLVAKDEDLNGGTIPLLTFARRPSTISSSFLVDITLSTFLCLKIRVKNPSEYEAMSWIKEIEMVDSLDEFKILAINCWKEFLNFEMLDARITSALNDIIPNSHFKKKVNLEEKEAQKIEWFLRRKQIAIMIHDCFRVAGVHESVLDAE